MLRLLKMAMDGGTVRRSFLVALIVGTVLNAINQGDAIVSGGEISLWKAALTYAVPFCVATYGAVSYRMSLKQGR